MGVREESTLGFAVVVSSLQIFADMEREEGSSGCFYFYRGCRMGGGW